MKDLVLWFDVLARASLGGLLAVVPRIAIGVLGLPKSEGTFWPRLLGTLLLALAAGTVVDARWPGKGGPLLGGLVAVNLAAAFALATGLVVGQLEIPRRGRFGLWFAALVSALLGLLQLAWV